MRRFKVFVSLLLGIVIVVGLLMWFRRTPDRQVVIDPLQPVRDKLTTITTRLGWKSAEHTGEKKQDGQDLGLQASGKLTITAGLHQDFVTGQVALADFLPLLQGHATYGDTNAPIVLLQRCDFGSTYCIDSYEQGTIFAYINAFPKTLSYQLKGYPRSLDPQVVLQHQASMCAESLIDAETFLSFYFALYQARGDLTSKELTSLAEKMKIDGFGDCLQSKSIVALQQEMKRGRSLFGFSTLPANVFINKQTGQYVLVPGLYETPDVLAAIQWLSEQ